MYKSSLSFAQAEKYLGILSNAGLLAENGGFWKTTEKEITVIESCKTCRLLSEQIQQEPK